MPISAQNLGSELKHGLAIEDLVVCVVGVVIEAIPLETAVASALVLLDGQRLGATRPDARQLVFTRETASSRVAVVTKAQGWPRRHLVVLILVVLLRVVEQDAGLLLVGRHLLELLGVGELWPARHTSGEAGRALGGLPMIRLYRAVHGERRTC